MSVENNTLEITDHPNNNRIANDIISSFRFYTLLKCFGIFTGLAVVTFLFFNILDNVSYNKTYALAIVYAIFIAISYYISLCKYKEILKKIPCLVKRSNKTPESATDYLIREYEICKSAVESHTKRANHALANMFVMPVMIGVLILLIMMLTTDSKNSKKIIDKDFDFLAYSDYHLYIFLLVSLVVIVGTNIHKTHLRAIPDIERRQLDCLRLKLAYMQIKELPESQKEDYKKNIRSSLLKDLFQDSASMDKEKIWDLVKDSPHYELLRLFVTKSEHDKK